MSTDRHLIKWVKRNFDYASYIDKMGISSMPTNDPDELRICCPVCGENDYKLYINTDKRCLSCFKCQLGYRGNGDLFDFVAAVEDVPVGVAIARVLADYRETTPEGYDFYLQEEKEDEEVVGAASWLDIRYIKSLPTGCKLISPEDEKAQPFLDYLLNRGFTLDEIIATQAHYTAPTCYMIGSSGKRMSLRERVVWPVYGGTGGLVSWLSRTTSSDPKLAGIKYINCLDSDLAKTFWPFVPVHKSKPEVYICEGLIDALAIRRAGGTSYAAFGKKLSNEQTQLLQHWGVETVNVFYDKDAKRETLKIATSLALKFPTVNIIDITEWPDGQDSGSLLKHPNGMAILQQAMNSKINIKNELAVAYWQMKE